MRNKTGIMEKTLKRVQGDKLGFTLAEVLITIGIIGVVAALTIPTLVNNYQTRSWNISSSNFEAKFGEALKIMNTQQTLAHLGTTERFVNELQKHMKITKVCNNEELTLCFPDEINGSTSVIDVTDPTTYENNSSKPTQTKTIKTARELGQKDWNTDTMGVQFANGVSAILAYNPKCSANPFDVNAVTVSGDKENITFGTDCVAMVYDTSSNAQPNEKGKDIRTSSMATVGDGDCIFKIDGACVTKVVAPISVSKARCEEMIQEGKITGCYYDSDYFAGAVDACSGTKNMASLSHIAKIANYLYEVEEITDQATVSGITRKNDRVSKLEFKYTSGSSFNIWANTENSNMYSYYRRINSDSTSSGGNGRRDNGSMLAVCVKR